MSPAVAMLLPAAAALCTLGGCVYEHPHAHHADHQPVHEGYTSRTYTTYENGQEVVVEERTYPPPRPRVYYSQPQVIIDGGLIWHGGHHDGGHHGGHH